MKYRIFILILALSSCRQNINTGNLYLVGYDTELDSSEESINYIKNQAIPKEYMGKIQYGTELIIKENKLVGAYRYNYGRRSHKVPFISFSYPFNKLEIEKNIPYEIIRGEDSKSFLGGTPPKNFKIPEFNDEIAFQYFGMLSKDDFPTDLLEFDLHLVAPIYDSFSELYLDYSDPLAPKIIEGNKSDFSRSFDEMNSNSRVTFNKTLIKFKKGGSLRYGFGYTGTPNWIQGPFYPRCPISGEEMKFLVSFDMDESREQIKVANLNFKVNEDNLRYFENLEFWISGAIYIFISPKNKTVCYFLQTT